MEETKQAEKRPIESVIWSRKLKSYKRPPRVDISAFPELGTFNVEVYMPNGERVETTISKAEVDRLMTGGRHNVLSLSANGSLTRW